MRPQCGSRPWIAAAFSSLGSRTPFFAKAMMRLATRVAVLAGAYGQAQLLAGVDQYPAQKVDGVGIEYGVSRCSRIGTARSPKGTACHSGLAVSRIFAASKRITSYFKRDQRG
jgi:hypothetical protein